MSLIYFLICLISCIIGAISGLGGGVIIKPVIDLLGGLDISTINFLSGCTVLSMSIVTLFRNRHSDIKVDKKKGSYLAIGAAFGGLFGKQLFELVKIIFGDPNIAGSIQSFLLGVVTIIILYFTINRSKIKLHKLQNVWVSGLIGLCLGCLSSFLGIGGGPINLAALYFFFSMDTKTAAINSIYLILFSQTASLLSTVFTRTIPPFEWSIFIMMIIGGILGGLIGSMLSQKISSKTIDRLFNIAMCFIILVSFYNGFNYLSLS